jgi:hypothetical protein
MDEPKPNRAGMTYRGIAEQLGVSIEAAKARVRRAGWRVERGNDGRALVIVPPGALDELPATKRPRRKGIAIGASKPDRDRGYKDLGELRATLMDQVNALEASHKAEIERLQAATDQHRQDYGDQLNAMRQQLDQARQDADAERERAEARHAQEIERLEHAHTAALNALRDRSFLAGLRRLIRG